MVVHSCNPSTQEVEAKELRIQGQSRLYHKTHLKKKENQPINFTDVEELFLQVNL
jgi:translation elongation factor EF-1beta